MFDAKPGQNSGRAEHLDLGEIGWLARQNARLFAGSAAALLLLVLVATLASRMAFRARGSLYLGEIQDRGTVRPQGSGPWDFLGGEGGDVGTEIEILRSQELIRRAVLESGLNVDLAPADSQPPRYWRWRISGRDSRLLDVGARHLVASGASVADSAGVEEFRLRMLAGGAYEIWRRGERLGTGLLGRELGAGGLSLRLDPGSDGAPPIGAIYTLAVRPADRVADDVARRLTVTVPKVTGPADLVKVVAIELAAPSPRGAARFVDTLMRAYLERRQSWKTEEATRAEAFVGGQVRGMKDALDEAERKLADYRKGSNVVVLSDEAKGMIDQLGKFEEQRVAARLRVAAFSQIQDLLKQQHAPIEQYLVGETDDPVLAGLSNNLALAQQELRKIEERFTPDAPAAKEQQSQVDGQLKMVTDYVVGRSTRAQRQLDSLGQMIAQFEKKLRTVPSAQFDLAQLTRNAEVLSRMYSFLLERQQQAAVTKASTISRNRVLDPAQLPYREDSPALGIRLCIAAFLGLLAGALLVIARRLLAPSFQSERELRRQLLALSAQTSSQSGQPSQPASILAVVPNAVRSEADPAARPAPPPASFGFAPGSLFAEAFRHLRTNLYMPAAGEPAKVVLVSSASPGDGKTVCAQALAAALAADGKHVLLINADLRGSARTANGDGVGAPGLGQILAGRCHWSDVVRPESQGAITFDLIPAGAPATPGPAELLSGTALAQLMTYARASYDFVVIDSPPYPLAVDALIISAHVDCVLTVLRIRNSDRSAAETHLQRFAALGARHGIIINGAEVRSSAKYAGQDGGPYGARAKPLTEREQLGAQMLVG